MSDLLKLALRAKLPIVKITSDDPDHLEDLLDDLSERTVVPVGISTASPSRWKPGQVYFDTTGTIDSSKIDYNTLLAKDQTFIVVNPDEGEWPHARDCGALVPPVPYLLDQIAGMLPKGQALKLVRYFAGMSLKDTIEVIMLTQARDGNLSATGINETKAYLGAGMAGLEALDTFQVDYVPPSWAEGWLQVDAPLLDNPKYRELWPKGFMLVGPTGTGKTEAARYIARRLKWPLFRLDLGSLYSRWQGQSEENLRRVLSFISAQGESVFLLDEAEKLFGNPAVGQASLSTLLSMLLWWLQGESNRTITVMTSNDLDVIPPELYRPGRLDAVHGMYGLTKGVSFDTFVQTITQRIAKAYDLDHASLSAKIDWSEGQTSQATIVALIRSEAKKMIVQKGTSQ